MITWSGIAHFFIGWFILSVVVAAGWSLVAWRNKR